jgi:fucose permease
MVLFPGNPVAASNFGNVFFGIGAFITPFLVGILLHRLGYKPTGIIIAFILLAPVIFALLATYPSVQKSGQTFAMALSNTFGLLANPSIIIAALALFCYIGLEASMGGWITTYATAEGFNPKSASIVLSSFWIGLMAARLITSQLVTPSNGVAVIAVLALIAAISLGLMIATRSKVMAAVCVVITGLSFGPLFPTIVGVTFSKIDPSLYGSTFGIIFAVGLLGGSTIPAAIGIYAQGNTIKKSLPIAVGTALVLFIIALVMGRL